MFFSKFGKFLTNLQFGSARHLSHPKGRRIGKAVHKLDPADMELAALRVVRQITKNGYRAYLVGGCIRDLLLGNYPKDFDVVSSASPYRLKTLFRNSRIIGRRFRILHVPINRFRVIEVSTFRSLPKHRFQKRKSVFSQNNSQESLLLRKDNHFGTSPEDAARRDITINALFYDIQREEIIDYCGGYEDLKAGLIRSIGDPEISFREDPVRMLRVAKFSALLNFSIEGKTIRGIQRLESEIAKSSKNRLLGEMQKIFTTGKSFQVFRKLHTLSLLKHILPEIMKPLDRKKNEDRASFFDKSLLGKRLAIADKMLSEREDLTANIFFALLCADLVEDLLEQNITENATSYLNKRLGPTLENIRLSKKNQHRIQQIFMSQSRFQRSRKAPPTKESIFRGKGYFYEAFTFFKIYAISKQNEKWIQQTMQWEFGPRMVPPRDSQSISLFQQHKPKKMARDTNHNNNSAGDHEEETFERPMRRGRTPQRSRRGPDAVERKTERRHPTESFPSGSGSSSGRKPLRKRKLPQDDRESESAVAMMFEKDELTVKNRRKK